MSKVHKIKLKQSFVSAVLSGEKNFEIRFNDRGYQKGDLIKFIPVIEKKDSPKEALAITKENSELEKKTFIITYLINGWGLENGYVAFGIKEVI